MNQSVARNNPGPGVYGAGRDEVPIREVSQKFSKRAAIGRLGAGERLARREACAAF